MEQSGRSYSLPLPRVWIFTVDSTVWTFYDDSFRGAVGQWLDIMEALGGDGWAPNRNGVTRLKVQHVELRRFEHVGFE